MKVYLASPLFTEPEREEVRKMASLLRANGHEVYVPMEHQIQNAWSIPNHEWGRKVFEEDIKAIDNSEIVMVLYYGLYSDSGTAWEQGYAYGKGKQIHVINCGCREASLMIVNGQTTSYMEQFLGVSQT